METKLIPTFRRGVLAPLGNLREEMDKLFEEWFGGLDAAPLRKMHGEGPFAYVPRVNVAEREKELVVTAELPGIDEKEVALELTKNALILKGEKRVEMEKKEEGFYRQERIFGSFYREIPLPWEVEVAKVAVDAAFKNGVLTVKIPKPVELAKAVRKIAIHA